MENPKSNKNEIDLPHTPDPPQIINPSSPQERDQKKKPLAESKSKKQTPNKKASKKTAKKTARKKR